MAKNKFIYELYDGYSGMPTSTFDPPNVIGAFIMNIVPLNDAELIFTETKKDDAVYYTKKVKNTLTFDKNSFAYFYGNIDNCVKYWVKIYKICEGVKTFIQLCYVNNSNIGFDLDSCNCSIDLQISSLYECIDKNKDAEIDINFNNTKIVYNTNSIGAYGNPLAQYKFAIHVVVPGGTYFPIAADLLTIVKELIRSLRCEGYQDDLPYKVISPISDFFNWQKVDTTVAGYLPGDTKSFIADLYDSAPAMGAAPTITEIPNYVNPSEYPYHIFMGLKSNLIDLGASNPGTRYSLSFSEMEQMLRDVFNVYWVLSTSDTEVLGGITTGCYIRFEHFSYFTKLVNYDAISGTNFPFNKYKNKIQIDKTENPIFENWVFNDSFVADFRGLPIFYGYCEGDNKSIIRENKKLTLNVDSRFTDPTKVYNKDGFVFYDMNFHPGYVDSQKIFVINSADYISGNLRINGRLSTTSIQEDLHKYNRPTKSGQMNLTIQTFLSPVYRKLQENILVKMCCKDPFEKTYSLVKTELGDGEIQEAEINYTKEIIIFKLKQQ